jgi:hypothetical protein
VTLFKDKIHVKHIVLNDAVAEPAQYRGRFVVQLPIPVDGLQRYYQTPESKPSEPSALSVIIDKVILKRVSVQYDDAYAGIFAAMKLGYLKLTYGSLT